MMIKLTPALLRVIVHLYTLVFSVAPVFISTIVMTTLLNPAGHILLGPNFDTIWWHRPLLIIDNLCVSRVTRPAALCLGK